MTDVEIDEIIAKAARDSRRVSSGDIQKLIAEIRKLRFRLREEEERYVDCKARLRDALAAIVIQSTTDEEIAEQIVTAVEKKIEPLLTSSGECGK